MEQVSRIGMDTSKHIFQLHGVDAAERACPAQKAAAPGHDRVLRAASRPRAVAIEACGASHHWARLLRGGLAMRSSSSRRSS